MKIQNWSVVKAKSNTKYANTNYILDINKTKRSIGTSGTTNPNICLYITSVWVCFHFYYMYYQCVCLFLHLLFLLLCLLFLLFFSASLSVFWNTIWNRYNLFVSCYRCSCSYCSSSSSCSCYCCCCCGCGCCCVGLTSRELRECSCRE